MTKWKIPGGSRWCCGKGCRCEFCVEGTVNDLQVAIFHLGESNDDPCCFQLEKWHCMACEEDCIWSGQIGTGCEFPPCEDNWPAYYEVEFYDAPGGFNPASPGTRCIDDQVVRLIPNGPVCFDTQPQGDCIYTGSVIDPVLGGVIGCLYLEVSPTRIELEFYQGSAPLGGAPRPVTSWGIDTQNPCDFPPGLALDWEGASGDESGNSSSSKSSHSTPSSDSTQSPSSDSSTSSDQSDSTTSSQSPSSQSSTSSSSSSSDSSSTSTISTIIGCDYSNTDVAITRKGDRGCGYDGKIDLILRWEERAGDLYAVFEMDNRVGAGELFEANLGTIPIDCDNLNSVILDYKGSFGGGLSHCNYAEACIVLSPCHDENQECNLCQEGATPVSMWVRVANDQNIPDGTYKLTFIEGGTTSCCWALEIPSGPTTTGGWLGFTLYQNPLDVSETWAAVTWGQGQKACGGLNPPDDSEVKYAQAIQLDFNEPACLLFDGDSVAAARAEVVGTAEFASDQGYFDVYCDEALTSTSVTVSSSSSGSSPSSQSESSRSSQSYSSLSSSRSSTSSLSTALEDLSSSTQQQTTSSNSSSSSSTLNMSTSSQTLSTSSSSTSCSTSISFP